MVLTGNATRNYRKFVLTFNVPALNAASKTKYYLLGNDGDVGMLLDGDYRVTAVSIQGNVTTGEADTLNVNVFKGTEASGAVLISSTDTTSTGTFADRQTALESGKVLADTEFAANTDDMIVTMVASGTSAVVADICVQVECEWNA